MYSSLLQAIYRNFGAHSAAEKEQLISDLREPARHIWSAFQNQNVVANYSDRKIQAAYLLRYYLPYSRFIEPTLALAAQSFQFPNAVRACFVGAGACPEALGLLQYLSRRVARVRLSVHLVDRHDVEWEFARGIALDTFLPAQQEGPVIACTGEALDITTGAICNQRFNIVVFQNCLNEVLGQNRFDSRKLAGWAPTVESGGLLVLIDRTGYSSITNFFPAADANLGQIGFTKIVGLPVGTVDVRDINRSMPAELINRLFYFANGALLPITNENNRLILKNKWDFTATVYRKN